MNKVIKITDDEVLIGKDDGSIIKTEKSNATWDVKVGDEVELFVDGNTIIPVLKKKLKSKKKNKFLTITSKLSQKIFIPLFTMIWALSLISIIVLGVIPRGDTYLYKDNIIGVDVSSKMVFSEDGMEIEALDENGEYKITSYSFKIVSGSLYVWSSERGEFEYWGKISSTKINLVSGVAKVELKEARLMPVKIVSIVLLSVFASLDLLMMILVVIDKCKRNKDNQKFEYEVIAEREEMSEIVKDK